MMYPIYIYYWSSCTRDTAAHNDFHIKIVTNNIYVIIVKPPNKGHIGARYNINSAVLSFVEWLSSLGGWKCVGAI